MLRIRKILFPTDLSTVSGQALPHAIFLARQFEAELHLLHAVVMRGDDLADAAHHFPEPQEILEKMYELAASEMADLLRPHRGQPLRIREVRERGLYAGPVILEYADEHEIDLVVMATHGRRGPKRLLLGSVAAEVIREARCPVLTLRGSDGPEAVEAIERLLVPIDFSEHSRRGLTYARELAAIYGAELLLAHVVEARPYPTFYGNLGATPVLRLVQQLRDTALEELERLWAETPGPEVAHQRVVVDGHAAVGIARLVEEREIDLVVVASHGLSGLERLLMGSTAEAVVRSVGCPVFTVKSFGRSLLET